jgi:hypothetical protein
MYDTMTIQIRNHKAVRLLNELRNLQYIEVLKEAPTPAKTKLSDKYRGVFSKEDAASFDEHYKTMRNEWNGT